MQFKSKIKTSFIISFFGVIFSATFSALAVDTANISPVVATPNTCKLMGDNLYSCTPFKCETSIPEEPNSKISNNIVGFNDKGECISIQSNERGEKVTCRYSEESRKFLGLKMKKAQTDLVNIPESSADDESMLADIFHNECDVISNEGGDDKPVVNEDEVKAIEDDEDESAEFQVNTEETNEDIDPEQVQDTGDLLDSK